MGVRSGGLGKGLDLIFMENNMETENTPITLKVIELEPNLEQPRLNFNEQALNELSESIIKHGIIQPIVVKPTVNGKYKIIAGERRWRASKLAGLSEVPVLIKDIPDPNIMELALVENLQREDLSVLEEAKGYKSLIDRYGFTQEEVAKSVGKSRSYVANTIRLLGLPEIVLEKLESGEITPGHARVFLSLESEKVEPILGILLSKGLNVRQLENLVKELKEKNSQALGDEKCIISNNHFKNYENELSSKFKRKVKIIGTKNKGTVQIKFSGEEDFLEICKLLLK